MTVRTSSMRTIAEARAQAQAGSATALAERHFDRIAEQDGSDGLDIHSFLALSRERALAQAARVDEMTARGQDAGPLAGVPVGIKDVLAMTGAPATAGSKVLAGYQPPYDADGSQQAGGGRSRFAGQAELRRVCHGIVERELRVRAGAQSPGARPGSRRLEWRVGGGGRGGFCGGYAWHGHRRLDSAACSVLWRGWRAADVRTRQPLRPDRVCLVARPRRAAHGKRLGRRDHADRPRRQRTRSTPPARTGRSRTSPPHSPSRSDGLRVGVPEEYFGDGLDPEIRAAIERTLDGLRAGGCELVKISLPHTRYAIPTYYVLATAEASSNLSRFDGVRFGLRSPKSKTLLDLFRHTREEGFGAEVKRRILLGTYSLSAGYYDAYYRKAQQVRTLVARDFLDAFTKCDVLVAPMTPTPPFKFGEKVDDPIAMYLADIYSVAASLAGICGMSVPCGETKDGLPIGVQVMGPALWRSHHAARRAGH